VEGSGGSRGTTAGKISTCWAVLVGKMPKYKSQTVRQQNTATALVAAELKAFRFKKTDLDLSAVLFPQISEPGRIRMNTKASYYIKLFSDLSWSFSFYGSRDNQPPPTLSGSDYGTSSGLGWPFGNR
jgi:hypothetical protein